MVVHGERLIGEDDRLPDFYLFVLELRKALRLLDSLLRMHDAVDGEWRDEEERGAEKAGFHDWGPRREDSTPGWCRRAFY